MNIDKINDSLIEVTFTEDYLSEFGFSLEELMHDIYSVTNFIDKIMLVLTKQLGLEGRAIGVSLGVKDNKPKILLHLLDKEEARSGNVMEKLKNLTLSQVANIENNQHKENSTEVKKPKFKGNRDYLLRFKTLDDLCDVCKYTNDRIKLTGSGAFKVDDTYVLLLSKKIEEGEKVDLPLFLGEFCTEIEEISYEMVHIHYMEHKVVPIVKENAVSILSKI